MADGDGGLLGGGLDGISGMTPSRKMAYEQMAQTIRTFLRDFPELNRLIRGVESSNRLIYWAIDDAIDDWNTTPPLIGAASIANFPSKRLLIRGATITLLESVGLLQTRNHLTFSDGGIQVGVSDKTPLIQSWLQYFKNDYEQKKLRLKVSMNIEQGWGGGTHSEYLWVNGFYGGW